MKVWFAVVANAPSDWKRPGSGDPKLRNFLGMHRDMRLQLIVSGRGMACISSEAAAKGLATRLINLGVDAEVIELSAVISVLQETRSATPSTPQAVETDSATPAGIDYGPFDSDDDACEANWELGFDAGWQAAVRAANRLPK